MGALINKKKTGNANTIPQTGDSSSLVSYHPNIDSHSRSFFKEVKESLKTAFVCCQ